MYSKLRMDIVGKEIFPESTIEILTKKYSLSFFREVPNGETREATHLWVDLNTRVNSEVFAKYPNLTHVICRATATTNISEDRSISDKLTTVSLVNHKFFLKSVPSTAELGWFLLQRSNIPATDIENQIANELWDRTLVIRNDLCGKKLGIIGFGRLGKLIANFAQPFGMTVSFTDLPEVVIESSHRRESITELCSSSDFLVVSASIKENRSPILDETILDKCRNGVKIINISRGKLVDEKSIYGRLLSGRISFYAADCARFEETDSTENDWDTYLRLSKLKNVYFTPHIGGYTHEAIKKTSDHLAEYLVKGKCVCIEL